MSVPVFATARSLYTEKLQTFFFFFPSRETTLEKK